MTAAEPGGGAATLRSPRIPLAAAILAEVTATLSLKGALTHPWLLVVVVTGYCLSFFLLALCLRRGMGIGVAYGIWGASGVVLTALMSSLLFGERMTLGMGAGIGLITLGVVMVELGSQRAHKAALAAAEPQDEAVA